MDEFRQYIADHGTEGPGAEWSDGIQDLQAQIDTVHQALINRTG